MSQGKEPIALFKAHTLEEHTQATANFFPTGRPFEAKNIEGTNFRKLLSVFSNELKRFEQLMIDITAQHNITTTTLLINEWERAVGIPDDCFKVDANATIEQRRKNVELKLAQLSAVSAEDFKQVASDLGFDIEIVPLASDIWPPYDIPLDSPHSQKAFFIWQVFGDNIVPDVPPYNKATGEFNPLTPTSGGGNILQCVFNKMKPSMSFIRFINN